MSENKCCNCRNYLYTDEAYDSNPTCGWYELLVKVCDDCHSVFVEMIHYGDEPNSVSTTVYELKEEE